MNEDTLVIDTIKINKSGVRDIFVPSRPVTHNFFCGRSSETSRIVNDISTPGLHVLLFGDRGVGKTSLANYSCSLVVDNGIKDKKIIVRCDKDDDFESISKRICDELCIDVTTKHTTTKNISATIRPLSGGKNTSEETSVYYDFNSPGWIAKQICHLNYVIILDEFDVISDKETKKKISQLLKNLSDEGAKTSFVIVGIALSATELLEGHPSVYRCLSEIKLNRMTDEELVSIIEKGEARLSIIFDKDVKKRIVQSSSGFPYFTHLLALKSSEIAIVEERDSVTDKIYERGLSKAIDSIEATLHEQYIDVVGDNEKKKDLLYCASLLGNGEFTSKQLRAKYKEITGIDIEQLEINNSIYKAISESTSTILRRKTKTKGIYFFNDPRMPVYIKLLREA